MATIRIVRPNEDASRVIGTLGYWVNVLPPRQVKWAKALQFWLGANANWEDDHLPRNGTAQGAALEFFQSMGGDALDTVGVTVVEGEHPGSTYYAAELTGDIDAANKAAADAGIPVRFKKSSR